MDSHNLKNHILYFTDKNKRHRFHHSFIMAKEEGAPPKYIKNSDGKFELNSEYKDWKEKKDLPVADATPVVPAANGGGSALTSSLTGGFLNSSLNESGTTKEFHLKQKFNLLADNFTIKSVPGDKKAYVVKGDKFKWGNQCSFQLLDGKIGRAHV